MQAIASGCVGALQCRASPRSIGACSERRRRPPLLLRSQVVLAGTLVCVGGFFPGVACGEPDCGSAISSAAKPAADESWVGGLPSPRSSSLVVKCIVATCAGSLLAVAGLVYESSKEAKRAGQALSREELGKLIPKKAAVLPGKEALTAARRTNKGSLGGVAAEGAGAEVVDKPRGRPGSPADKLLPRSAAECRPAAVNTNGRSAAAATAAAAAAAPVPTRLAAMTPPRRQTAVAVTAAARSGHGPSEAAAPARTPLAATQPPRRQTPAAAAGARSGERPAEALRRTQSAPGGPGGSIAAAATQAAPPAQTSSATGRMAGTVNAPTVAPAAAARQPPASPASLRRPSSCGTVPTPPVAPVAVTPLAPVTSPDPSKMPRSCSAPSTPTMSVGRPRGWSSGTSPGGGRELSEVEKRERQIKSILNKLTREKFDSLYWQLLGCCEGCEACPEIVQVIAREVFAKATLQHSFIEMYADVCARLHTDLTCKHAEVNFKRVLLDQCQQSFTKYLEPIRTDETLDYEEQYEALVKYKTRMLGNARLIGHLLRLRMLSPKIIFVCTDELLDIGSPEALETLCAFLETLGATFDGAQGWTGKTRLDEVFYRVDQLANDEQQAPRMRCLLKDVLDKRKRGWGDCPAGGIANAPPSGGSSSRSESANSWRQQGALTPTSHGHRDASVSASPVSTGRMEGLHFQAIQA